MPKRERNQMRWFGSTLRPRNFRVGKLRQGEESGTFVQTQTAVSGSPVRWPMELPTSPSKGNKVLQFHLGDYSAMKRHLSLWILIAMPLVASDNKMWVNISDPNLAVERENSYASDHIDVIDLKTHKVVQTI